MNRKKIVDILESTAGQQVLVKGWIRNRRASKNVLFITINDGSTINSLQVVLDVSLVEEALSKKMTTGASVEVSGIVTASQGTQQEVEVQASAVSVLGEADPDVYPLQPKKHSMEFLREIAHLRPRTNTFGAIFRIRHHLFYSIHHFFHQRGFFCVQTPIITASDAEGAGETFKVTTLDLQTPPKNPEGQVDYSQDFFAKQTNLTVSGQLEGELAALGLGEVYTFGPTFRAENSNTTRHLSEFWMLEPEMAFYNLNDTITLAQELLHRVLADVLVHCHDDLIFLEQRALKEDQTKPTHLRSEFSLIEKIKMVTEKDFVRISYTEAINILQRSKANQKGKFQFPVEKWGMDLQAEHERYLVEKHFKTPVVIYDYPQDIKAFYMRQNDDEKTVAALDVLFPGIGEIVGGSQREERLEKLKLQMQKKNIPQKDLEWYLDTRRFGTVPHSGFGLGFERLVQFVTGMSNIRDVIPFPRVPGSCEF